VTEAHNRIVVAQKTPMCSINPAIKIFLGKS